MSNDKLANTNYAQLHVEVLQMPMDFISGDLIHPYKVTFRGNQYALTVIGMLTNYIICIFLVDKSADMVVYAYLKEIHYRLGESQKVLSDNGSEFKNALFLEVPVHLGIKHIYSSLS